MSVSLSLTLTPPPAPSPLQYFWHGGVCSRHYPVFFCVLFQGTDGKSLLSLTKDQIMDVIGFKIGPTLKIYHLIQQLKIKSQKANLKKSYLR